MILFELLSAALGTAVVLHLVIALVSPERF